MTTTGSPKNRIIYIDDDRDDLDLLSEAFEQYTRDTELICFENGIPALNYLDSLSPKDPQPCLIILDINMPFLNGKEVLQKLRDRSPYRNTPVVLFTTSSQPFDRDFALLMRAGFITKPLQFKQLNQIIGQLIEHCSDDIRTKIKKEFI